MSNGCQLTRGELLDWINTLLGTNYTKVEETSNGAAFCQVIDAIFPGTIRLSRVNFNASSESEMIANYKILQNAFVKQNIDKQINVETLIKGKCMASLEMLQWIKQFFDQNYNGGEYDGPGRRAQCKCKEPGSVKNSTASRASGRVSFNQLKTAPTPRRVVKHTTTATPAVKTAKTPMKSTVNRGEPASAVKPKVNTKTSAMTPGIRTQKTTTSSLTEIRQLKTQLEEMKKDNQILLEERTFYYEKLQKIEVICQDNPDNELSGQILNILYETDEAHGFVAPDELDI